MLDRTRHKLTYANVMSTIAIFGVLAGGGAWAASKIGPEDIGRSAIKTRHLGKNAVRASKIGTAAVKTPKIKDGAVTMSKLAEGLEGPRGPAGPQGEQGPPGPSASWALIDMNGNVVAQSGGFVASHLGSAVYKVTFPDSLAGKNVMVSNALLDGDAAGRGETSVAVCGSGHGANAVCTANGVTDDTTVLVVTMASGETANEQHAFSIAAF
jgi:hypothetical protein